MPVLEAQKADRSSLFLKPSFATPCLSDTQGDQLSQPGAVRAFRSQLPRINPFYGYHPAEEQDTLPLPLPSLSPSLHPHVNDSSCHSQPEAGQVRGERSMHEMGSWNS